MPDFKINESGEAYLTGRNYNKVYVSKLNAEGSDLIFENILDGSENAYSNSISINAIGQVYITGTISSEDFLITSNEFDNSYNGGEYDIFVAKISDDGSYLMCSTFLGGEKGEYPNDIEIDESGNVLLTGYNNSREYPVTDENVEIGSVFVTILDDELSKLIYSSKLSGNYGIDIAFQNTGDILVVGNTDYYDNHAVTGGIFDMNCIKYHENGPFIKKLALEKTTKVDRKENERNNLKIKPHSPNPFNNSTTISYFLAQGMHINISIFNLNGQKVENLISEYQIAGRHEIKWEASIFPSGIYFYTFKGDNVYKTEKMLLLK